jgi:hypothetical protein
MTVNKGAPEGYATAMRLTNFTISATTSSSDPSNLQPLPFYAIYKDRTVSASIVLFVAS